MYPIWTGPVSYTHLKVKDLRLIVEEGEADYNDHALWADAKFTFQSETPDPKPIKVASSSVTADKTELPASYHRRSALSYQLLR